MGLRRWLRRWLVGEERQDSIREWMLLLEAELALLNKQIEAEKATQGKIVIEELNVDKITVDKLEYHNNFGALGIKELKGRLNIGANYGVGFSGPIDEGIKQGLQAAMEQKQEQNRSDTKNTYADKQAGPKVSIHSKDL